MIVKAVEQFVKGLDHLHAIASPKRSESGMDVASGSK
jgi:hypothetical protein